MSGDVGRSARILRSTPFRYIFSIAATAGTLFACRWLIPLAGDTIPYLVLFPVVTLVAWYGGIGPAIVTVLLALGGVMYWLTPGEAARFPDAHHAIAALVFLIASSVITVLGEAAHRDNARLRTEPGELENRVGERTAELDSASQHLRRLSARLLHLQDEERRRIARELHDSVGQMLAALSMNLTGVRDDLDRLTKATAAVVDSENLVQEMIKEVRTISHLLHPPLLDEAGLPSALRWYVDGFSQRSKIAVNLDCPTDFGRLPRDVETAVFRLVQECLTNIHRHSGSDTATIHVLHDAEEVILTVEDKGKGIPEQKLDEMSLPGTAGVGITGMRERVLQLGGTLAIDSDRSGTRIAAHIPIPGIDAGKDRGSLPETSSSAAA